MIFTAESAWLRDKSALTCSNAVWGPLPVSTGDISQRHLTYIAESRVGGYAKVAMSSCNSLQVMTHDRAGWDVKSDGPKSCAFESSGIPSA